MARWTLTGQDLGDGVEQVFGPGIREYEWIWTLRPLAVAKLISALNNGDDIIQALKSRFSNDAAADIPSFFETHTIQYENWSRLGD